MTLTRDNVTHLKASVRAYYQQDSGTTYDARRFESFQGRVIHQHEIQALRTLMADLSSKRSVLEAGAGTGRFSAELARAGHRVTALDQSTRMLQRLRQRMAEEGHRAPAGRGDVEHLPFADNSFDLVISLRVLWHFEDPRAALREYARVVRPGGHVIVDSNNFLRLDLPLVATKRLTDISMNGFGAGVYTSYLLPHEIDRQFSTPDLHLERRLGVNYVPGPDALLRRVGESRLAALEARLQRHPSLAWFGISTMMRFRKHDG